MKIKKLAVITLFFTAYLAFGSKGENSEVKGDVKTNIVIKKEVESQISLNKNRKPKTSLPLEEKKSNLEIKSKGEVYTKKKIKPEMSLNIVNEKKVKSKKTLSENNVIHDQKVEIEKPLYKNSVIHDKKVESKNTLPNKSVLHNKNVETEKALHTNNVVHEKKAKKLIKKDKSRYNELLKVDILEIKEWLSEVSTTSYLLALSMMINLLFLIRHISSLLNRIKKKIQNFMVRKDVFGLKSIYYESNKTMTVESANKVDKVVEKKAVNSNETQKNTPSIVKYEEKVKQVPIQNIKILNKILPKVLTKEELVDSLKKINKNIKSISGPCYINSIIGNSSNNDDYSCNILLGNVHVIVYADGLGGHNFGAEASFIAIKEVLTFLIALDLTDYKIHEALCKEAIIKASNLLIKTGDELSILKTEMRTTLSIILFDNKEKKLSFSHAGDGGAYLLFENNEFLEIMKPHNGTSNSIVSSSLGVDGPPAIIDSGTNDLINKGKSLLLCGTDGITEVIEAHELMKLILNRPANEAKKTVDSFLLELKKKKNQTGSFIAHDNMTCGLLYIN